MSSRRVSCVDHLHRWRWIASCVLLVLGVLFLLAFPHAPSQTSSHASPLSDQLGGRGGGAQIVATTPTPTTPIRLYGARGQSGKTCLGTSGTPAEMIKRDFQWDASLLRSAYQQKKTRIRLCNDYWFWETTTALIVKEVLADLHWPADLLQESYLSQQVLVSPLQQIDSQTHQEQLQERYQQFASTGPCDWVPDLILAHPHINVCDPIKGLIRAGAEGLRTLTTSLQDQISFLWTTPTDAFTQESSGLPRTWRLSWGLVLTFLTVVIAWAGLRILVGSTLNWLSYASVIEVLPKILCALVLAYFSRHLVLGLIHINNATAHVFADTSLKSMITAPASRTAEAILHIIYALMSLLLIAEAAARMAILYLLFAFAPVLLFCAALQETQAIARAAITAMILFTFLQTIQLAVLDVGGHLLASVLQGSAGNLLLLHLLVGIVLLYLTITLFFTITNLSLGSSSNPFGSGIVGFATGMAMLGPRFAARRAMRPAIRVSRGHSGGSFSPGISGGVPPTLGSGIAHAGTLAGKPAVLSSFTPQVNGSGAIKSSASPGSTSSRVGGIATSSGTGSTPRASSQTHSVAPHSGVSPVLPTGADTSSLAGTVTSPMPSLAHAPVSRLSAGGMPTPHRPPQTASQRVRSRTMPVSPILNTSPVRGPFPTTGGGRSHE